MFNSPYLMIDEISLITLMKKSENIQSINIEIDKTIIKQDSIEIEKAFNLKPVLQKEGNKAIIQIDGPIVFNPLLIERIIFSAVSTQEIMKAVADVSQDDDIELIVFAINSPGGEAFKMHVLSDMIHALSMQKATAAVNTGLMASAAFFIGSQTNKIFVEDHLNETGSIGTVTVLRDFTEAAKMAGIKVTKIATGPLKGAGITGTPITSEMIQSVQEKVDKIQEGFSSAVERMRPTADMSDGSEARSGQSFFFEKAQELGLVDDIKNIDQAFEFLEHGISFSKLKQSI